MQTIGVDILPVLKINLLRRFTVCNGGGARPDKLITRFSQCWNVIICEDEPGKR